MIQHEPPKNFDFHRGRDARALLVLARELVHELRARPQFHAAGAHQLRGRVRRGMREAAGLAAHREVDRRGDLPPELVPAEEEDHPRARRFRFRQDARVQLVVALVRHPLEAHRPGRPPAAGALSRERVLPLRVDGRPVAGIRAGPLREDLVDAAEVRVRVERLHQVRGPRPLLRDHDEALARFWYQGDVGRGRREGGRNCHREASRDARRPQRGRHHGAAGQRHCLAGGHLCVPGCHFERAAVAGFCVSLPSRALCASGSSWPCAPAPSGCPALYGAAGQSRAALRGESRAAPRGGSRACSACSLGPSLCSAGGCFRSLPLFSPALRAAVKESRARPTKCARDDRLIKGRWQSFGSPSDRLERLCMPKRNKRVCL